MHVERDRLLYVLRAQEDEVSRLGAKRLPGDCRWHIPASAGEEAVRQLRRFQSERQMEQWILERVGDMAPEMLDRIAMVMTGPRGGDGNGQRIYLHVPRGERVQARRLGAEWDERRQRLYVVEGTDLQPFRQYLTAAAVERQAIEVGREVRSRSRIRDAAARIAAEDRVIQRTLFAVGQR